MGNESYGAITVSDKSYDYYMYIGYDFASSFDGDIYEVAVWAAFYDTLEARDLYDQCRIYD